MKTKRYTLVVLNVITWVVTPTRIKKCTLVLIFFFLRKVLIGIIICTSRVFVGEFKRKKRYLGQICCVGVMLRRLRERPEVVGLSPRNTLVTLKNISQ